MNALIKSNAVLPVCIVMSYLIGKWSDEYFSKDTYVNSNVKNIDNIRHSVKKATHEYLAENILLCLENQM